MSSSRLEAVLRAGQQQRASAPVGVVRWEPPPGMVWDEDGEAVPEPPAGGNPHRLPAGQEWVSASVMEGERAREEQEMDHALIDSIPRMQQQIRSLMRYIITLRNRIEDLERPEREEREREERERERGYDRTRDPRRDIEAFMQDYEEEQEREQAQPTFRDLAA